MMLEQNQDTMSIGYPMLPKLKKAYGFDLWMIMRIHGDDCIVLAAEGDSYDISQGMVFKLNRTNRLNLSNFSKPKIVSNVDANDEQLPFVNNHFNIKSYLHIPIINKTHHFIGSLCAISSKPQPKAMIEKLEEINVFHQTVSERLDEILLAATRYQAESRALVVNDIDKTTKLYNWRGWERLLDREEARCRSLGFLGDIITIELTGLAEHMSIDGGESAEALLKDVAKTIQAHVIKDSMIAHIGRTEFVICSVNNTNPVEQYGNSILQALKDRSIAALLGYARSIPNKGLRDAWEHAEHMLYKHKNNMLVE